MVYVRNANGELALESASFGGGRFRVADTGEGTTFTPNYFITDHLGSTRAIISSDGTVVDRNDYYPYGLEWESTGSQVSDNRYLYNGKEKQTVGIPAGVNYMDYGARILDLRLGSRWLSLDPMEQYHSGYVYCGNNPINLIDPTGMFSVTLTGAAAVAAFEKLKAAMGDDDPEERKRKEEEEERKKREKANLIERGMQAGTGRIPHQWEYYIPVWGSALLSEQAWNDGRYFDAAGWVFIGLAEGFSLGLLAYETQWVKAATLSAARASATNVSSLGLRSFTQSNFRYNLGRLTGKVPANAQAHHVFPVKYNEKFLEVGINIHDPRFGVWWEASSHAKNAAAYNMKWDVFFFHNSKPTAFQIMNQGRYLMSGYGVPVRF